MIFKEKNRMKKMFVIVCVLILMGIGYLAGYSTAANPICIKLDGVDVGCSPPPTIIGGKTFVPLKCIGQIFGVAVNWDAKNRCVLLGTPPVGLDMVTELPPFKQDNSTPITSVTISGVSYNKGFLINSKISWRLNGNYSKITFSHGQPDDAYNNGGLYVYGDGKQIGWVDQPKTSQGLKQYEIDVRNVNILEIDRMYYTAAMISPRIYK